MDRPAISRPAGSYAQKWVDRQREAFKRLGVFGRWDTPYLTMSKRLRGRRSSAPSRAPPRRASSTAARSRSTGASTDRTALAEAEVEYEDHTSPSIYVAFDARRAAPRPEGSPGKKARLVIWTTTPWTLPANLAIVGAPRASPTSPTTSAAQVVVVAKDLLARFLADVAPDELAARRADPALAAAHEAATGGGGAVRRRAPRATRARPRVRSRGKALEGAALPPPVHRPRVPGHPRRARDARGRHRPRPHRARPRPGGLRGRPALRARGPEPGRRRRPLHRRGRASTRARRSSRRTRRS